MDGGLPLAVISLVAFERQKESDAVRAVILQLVVLQVAAVCPSLVTFHEYPSCVTQRPSAVLAQVVEVRILLRTGALSTYCNRRDGIA